MKPFVGGYGERGRGKWSGTRWSGRGRGVGSSGEVTAEEGTLSGCFHCRCEGLGRLLEVSRGRETSWEMRRRGKSRRVVETCWSCRGGFLRVSESC
jgi:hypothetical protein